MSASKREPEKASDDAIVRAVVRAARPEGNESGDPRSPRCPDAETLAARHEGRLESRQARAVDEHATSCRLCAETLAFLGEARWPDATDATDAATIARRNRLALALGVAAVAAVIVVARFLLVAAGGGSFSGARPLRAGGVVVAARGTATLAGDSAPILPGDVLDAGASIALGRESALVVATSVGFRSLGAWGEKALAPDDAVARSAASALHERALSRSDRLERARDSALRVERRPLDLVYPADQIVDPRPEFLLAQPSDDPHFVVLRRGDPREPDLFRIGPVSLPCPFPESAPPLEPGVEYRVSIETKEGALAASAVFRLEEKERRESVRLAVEAAARAVGGSGETDVATSLVYMGLGFPSEALRAGLRAARTPGVSRGFLYEMGMAARSLSIESLAAPWLDGP